MTSRNFHIFVLFRGNKGTWSALKYRDEIIKNIQDSYIFKGFSVILCFLRDIVLSCCPTVNYISFESICIVLLWVLSWKTIGGKESRTMPTETISDLIHLTFPKDHLTLYFIHTTDATPGETNWGLQELNTVGFRRSALSGRRSLRRYFIFSLQSSTDGAILAGLGSQSVVMGTWPNAIDCRSWQFLYLSRAQWTSGTLRLHRSSFWRVHMLLLLL